MSEDAGCAFMGILAIVAFISGLTHVDIDWMGGLALTVVIAVWFKGRSKA